MTRRTIVIGDIHGCIDEFKELLDKVKYEKGRDRLLLLGDLIDKGPDPAAVVAYAHDMNAGSIVGNHEEKALRWRRHEVKRKADPTHYKNPMSVKSEKRLEEWNSIPDKLWEWVASWPIYEQINAHWSAVHGGCMPGISLNAQASNELMRLRYVKGVVQPSGYVKYRMASLNEKGEVNPPGPGETLNHWTELWSGSPNIVYGHYAREHIHETESGDGTQTLGLDTSCVHGGMLTAAIFGDTASYSIEYVKANRVYSEARPWNDMD